MLFGPKYFNSNFKYAPKNLSLTADFKNLLENSTFETKGKPKLKEMIEEYPIVKYGDKEVSSLNIIILWAARYGYIEVLKFALEHHRLNAAETNEHIIGIALTEAIQSNHKDIAKLLIKDERFDPTVNTVCMVTPTVNPLLTAANKGDLEILNLLLKFPKYLEHVKENISSFIEKHPAIQSSMADNALRKGFFDAIFGKTFFQLMAQANIVFNENYVPSEVAKLIFSKAVTANLQNPSKNHDDKIDGLQFKRKRLI